MMWNLHRLAEKKTTDENEIEDWVRLLSRAESKAHEAGLNKNSFEQLIESLKSDYHLVEIFEIMAEHGRRHPRNPQTFQMLTEYVDESDASLADWLEAMALVCGWLYKERKSAIYEDILGYIHCCDMGQSGTGTAPLLASEVEDCLNQHGFERAQDWNATGSPAPSTPSAP